MEGKVVEAKKKIKEMKWNGSLEGKSERNKERNRHGSCIDQVPAIFGHNVRDGGTENAFETFLFGLSLLVYFKEIV